MLGQRHLIPLVIPFLAAACAVPPADPAASEDTSSGGDVDAFVANPGEAPPPIARSTFRARERARGHVPARLDHRDGTWSLELDPEFDPSLRVRGATLTWRYVGQARYSAEPQLGGERSFIVQPPRPNDLDSQLSRVRRIDRAGRIWEVDGVDHESVQENSRLASVELDGAWDEASLDENDALVGTEIRWTPTSWDNENCAPGGGVFTPNELHIWNGEGRVSDSTPEDQDVPVFSLSVNGSRQCTASVLQTGSRSYALTAAHCVSDSNNNPISTANDNVMLCRSRSGWECFAVGDITLASNYAGGTGDGGGTDFGDDWALLEMDDDLPVLAEDQEDHMHLSTAGDATLEGLGSVYNQAFPQYGPDCDIPSGFYPYKNREIEPIAEVASKRLKLKIDGGPGHSGSPVYYCPAGDNELCSSDDMAHVIGVWAGWNSTWNRHVAAKVSSFASAADAIMND